MAHYQVTALNAEPSADSMADQDETSGSPVPVAWRFKGMVGMPWSLTDDAYYVSCKRDQRYIIEPLYTAPTPRKPLTDEEIDELSRTMVKGDRSVNWLCRAIERAHGIGDSNEPR